MGDPNLTGTGSSFDDGTPLLVNHAVFTFHSFCVGLGMSFQGEPSACWTDGRELPKVPFPKPSGRIQVGCVCSGSWCLRSSPSSFPIHHPPLFSKMFNVPGKGDMAVSQLRCLLFSFLFPHDTNRFFLYNIRVHQWFHECFMRVTQSKSHHNQIKPEWKDKKRGLERERAFLCMIGYED